MTPPQQSRHQDHPRLSQRRNNTDKATATATSILYNSNPSCVIQVARITALVLLAVKVIFFLHDNDLRRRPFFYNVRPPVRERHGTVPMTAKKSLQLKFREKITNQSDTITFKILQLTDMHFGEATFTDWGPEQDRKTFQVLDTVILWKNQI